MAVGPWVLSEPRPVQSLPVPYRQIEDPAKLRRLMAAVLSIEADLSLPVLLRHLTEEACSLVDARYGALGVLDPSGQKLEEFITVGLTRDEERAIGPRPTGKGVLGLIISEPVPLRLDQLGEHPRSSGFPINHPHMTTFLGVPVKVRDEVYGNLYLTDKRKGLQFSEEDESLVSALAAAAGIAIENARLHSQVRELALLEDRDRIARDLHDTVIQRLFAIGLSLQGTTKLTGNGEVSERISTAVADLDETIRGLRTAIFDLQFDSQGIGVRRSVLDLAEEIGSTIGVRVDVTTSGPVDTAVTSDELEHLLATVREALTNVGKHARATKVSLSLAVGDELVLTVADNGQGGDLDSPSPGSQGLKNMRSRAEKLGGSMTLDSPGGGGTRLVWRVPL
jgi:signal transduction histidine kinase